MSVGQVAGRQTVKEDMPCISTRIFQDFAEFCCIENVEQQITLGSSVLRSSVYVTQRELAVGYRRFGTTIGL